jgi:hypothetical protein
MAEDTKINRSRLPGPDNPNWKGGRVVASNGYVLIRVGKDHPLADVRGYAYEHRIVAAQMMGRNLDAGEIIHHKNGVKTDNRPENLEVVMGNAEHRVHHRLPGSRRRLPGESNPTVLCGCGCGETFDRFDDTGRPREFVSGHNPVPSPRASAILARLADRPHTVTELAGLFGISRGAICTALSKLAGEGRATRIGRGLYARKEG